MKGLEELMRVNINTCPCVNISPCLLGTGGRASFLLSLEATEVDKGRWDILLPLNCSKRKCSSPYIYPSLMKSLMTLLRQYKDLFPLGEAKQSYIEFTCKAAPQSPAALPSILADGSVTNAGFFHSAQH